MSDRTYGKAMTNCRLTPQSATRLAFVRQLLLRAEDDAGKPEPLCVTAVLTLHDAAELFLVLVAEATGASVKAGAAFLEYWQPINDRIKPKELGHKAIMKAVSDARRGFKHSGVVPSKSEIQRFARSTREFLVDGAMLIFGAEFDLLTMSDTLPAGNPRDALKAAEQAIVGGDVQEALGKARLAFEYALRDADDIPPPSDRISYERWNRRLRPGRNSFHSSFFLGLNDLDRELAKAWDELQERAERTETAVHLMARGVNYDEYVLFQGLTPSVFFPMGREEPLLQFDGSLEPTLDEATWCVEFATNSVLAVYAR